MAKVVNVSEHTAGSELSQDATDALYPSPGLYPDTDLYPSGIRELVVVDIIDFDADGGYVTIVDEDGNEETVAYTYTPPEDGPAEDGSGVLNLVDSLTATYLTGDPVYLTDQNGRRYVERWADVMEPQAEEALRIRVPHALYALLPLGIREEGTEEQVTFAQEGTDHVVTDMLGKGVTGFELRAAASGSVDDVDAVRWTTPNETAARIYGLHYDSVPRDDLTLQAFKLRDTVFAQLRAEGTGGTSNDDATVQILVTGQTAGGAVDGVALVRATSSDGDQVVEAYADGQLVKIIDDAGTSDFLLDNAWTSWTPTLTGWSANPASGVYRYKQEGKKVTIQITQPNSGTSNATTKTITVPVTAATVTNHAWEAPARVIDNGTLSATPGLAQITSGGTTISFFKDYAGAAWTASGSHRIVTCHLVYEAA